MSGAVKAKRKAPVDDAKRSWLAKFLGFKMPWDDDEEDEQGQEPETVDPRAAKLAGDLINAHGEAVDLGLDLGGQREQLKSQAEQQILDKDYDTAQGTIATLRDTLAKTLEADEKAWKSSGFAAAADGVDTLAGDADPQSGTLKDGRARIQALADARKFRAATDAAPGFIDAVKQRTDLYPARKDWAAGADARKAAIVQADEAIAWGADLAAAKSRLTAMEGEAKDEARNYATLGSEAADLIKTVAEAHAKVKEAREKWLAAASKLEAAEKHVAELEAAKTSDAATHRAALDKVKEAEKKPDFDAALKALETLAPLVEKAAENTRARLDYEGQRAAMAKDEVAVKRIPDTPGALKDLKDAYLASAAKTQESVTKNEFGPAVTSLTQLKADLKAALDAKRTATEQATKGKVDSLKQKLNGPSSTPGKVVWQNVGQDDWGGAVDDILTIQLDEDFQKNYDEICDTVAGQLAHDPDVQDGFKNWKKWTKDASSIATNADNMKRVMNKVLALQSKVLGLDPSTPVSTYTNSDKTDCGGFNGTTVNPDGTKGAIGINVNSDDFDDFKELLDTLTHENTHAYQEKLIKDFRDGKLLPGDPNYNAAMVLDANDTATHGYVGPTNSEKYEKKYNNGKDPYNDQACEVHAWGAGRRAGQGAYKQLKQKKSSGSI